jgi:Ni/Co efflux regulator RcnB
MKTMKKTLLSGLALAVVATTGFAGTANAAPPNYNQNQQRDDHRGNDHRNDNNFRNGAYVVNGHRYERARGPAWHAPKNWQRHNWQRGQRMPTEYRRVVVNDYRNYHLAPPPRGYQYVRDGNDIVMTAIASGIIGAVIAGVFSN